jgi:hypothetical protein
MEGHEESVYYWFINGNGGQSVRTDHSLRSAQIILGCRQP